MGAIDNERAVEDLRSLLAYRERVQASVNRRFVETLAWYRDRGVPWTVLAEGLGVRKQTAHESWAHAVRARLEAHGAHVRRPNPEELGELAGLW